MVRKLLNVVLNKWLLVFLIGILLSTTLHFRTEYIYEDALFEAIVDKINEDTKNSHSIDSFFIRAMQITRILEKNRLRIFGGKKIDGIKANLFRPATIDLMTGDGACGSYATVLARTLKAGGYQVRLAQMTVNGIPAGHIVVEAKKRSNWIVLDPMMRMYFKKPDSTLASFKDVQQNWDYYKNQTRPKYIASYKYEGVRYTNWDKYPFIGNITKKIIALFKGTQAAEEFSIRSFLLRKYYLFFLGTASLLTLFIILLAISFIRSRKIN